MLNSSLCDYSDEYILGNGTLTVPNTDIAAAKKIIKKYNNSKLCSSS